MYFALLIAILVLAFVSVVVYSAIHINNSKFVNKIEVPDGIIPISKPISKALPKEERKKKEYRSIFDDVENPW